ncbi:MAG: hypothetical protein GX452_12655 [Ignavibacteriales bacterium]|nr:hypothetical protein [Ignavibacteriales bacterium]
MKKIYIYLIGALLIMLALLAWQNSHLHKLYIREKIDRERLFENNLQLFSENRRQTELIYTKDEFLKIMSDSLKKTLRDLKIKPKTVTQIIEKTIIQELHDTIIVPVKVIGKNWWEIKDTGPCFLWQGEARLFGDSLAVDRTDFIYQNKTTDYYYRKLKGRFLFLKFYSRNEIEHKTVSDCGDTIERVVRVERR